MSSSEIEKKKRALPRAPATGPRRAPPQLDEAGCAGVASVRGRRRVFVGGCWGGTAGANAAVTGAAESFRLIFFRAHMHGVCYSPSCQTVRQGVPNRSPHRPRWPRQLPVARTPYPPPTCAPLPHAVGTSHQGRIDQHLARPRAARVAPACCQQRHGAQETGRPHTPSRTLAAAAPVPTPAVLRSHSSRVGEERSPSGLSREKWLCVRTTDGRSLVVQPRARA